MKGRLSRDRYDQQALLKVRLLVRGGVTKYCTKVVRLPIHKGRENYTQKYKDSSYMDKLQETTSKGCNWLKCDVGQ